MENTKTQQPINTTDPKQYMSSDLLIALYWVWDAFERANMPFFLVKGTARSVKENKELHGDGIDIGVRFMEWASGAKRILDSFIGDPISEENGVVTYEHIGIPIRIHLYHDSDHILAPDTVMYKNEYFKIPNPLDQFEKLYD